MAPVPDVWDGSVLLQGESLDALASRVGGRVVGSHATSPHRLVPVAAAGEGDLAPVLASRHLQAARQAAGRGAALLIDASLEAALAGAPRAWVHEHATWALAGVLDRAIVPDVPPIVGEGSRVAPTAVLGPRVVIGARVTIGPGAVVGHPGFGWAWGPGGAVRAVPQVGGVVLEDDVSIGPLCTIDAGTLAPTRIRRGAKLDAHVHVGHNSDVGEGTILAAQCGLAGSVTLGRGVLVGGQAGFADHVTVGDGARVAAKSGVIGDVPPGAVVAGYPAVARARWLRALASLYRGTSPAATSARVKRSARARDETE
jgi:UDP-3-O-[3-hydroxymyristoyl] glucosamine N-acyltransferase